MTPISLNQILERLETMKTEELHQLDRTIQKHLAKRQDTVKQAAFHQALIDSGLVKQIKHPAYDDISDRQLISVKGKPVSETIIEERR